MPIVTILTRLSVKTERPNRSDRMKRVRAGRSHLIDERIMADSWAPGPQESWVNSSWHWRPEKIRFDFEVARLARHDYQKCSTSIYTKEIHHECTLLGEKSPTLTFQRDQEWGTSRRNSAGRLLVP